MATRSLTLTADFLQVATAASVSSYKAVQVQATFHRPDHPGILQTFAVHMYDRLNTGVENIMVLRAAIDEPTLTAELLAAYQKQFSAVLDDADVGLLASAGIDQQFEFASQERVQSLRERTMAAIGQRLLFAQRNFDARLNFRDPATDLIHLEFAAQTRYFERLKSFVRHWMREIDGPLHSIDLAVSDIASHEELQDAVAQVTAAENAGRQIVRLETRTPSGMN